MANRKYDTVLAEIDAQIAAMEAQQADMLATLAAAKELRTKVEQEAAEEEKLPKIKFEAITISETAGYEHRLFYGRFAGNGTTERPKPWRIRIRDQYERELNGDLVPQKDFYFSERHDIMRAIMFGIHMYRLGALHAGKGDALAYTWPEEFLSPP